MYYISKLIEKFVIVTLLVLSQPVNAQRFDLSETPIPQTEEELNNLLSKLRGSALPQMQTLERCVRTTNDLVMEYVGIRKLYTQKVRTENTLAIDADTSPTSSNFDVNIFYNFDQMATTNNLFFLEVNNFVDLEMSSPLEDMRKIESNLASLDKRLEELNSKLYPVIRKETQFLYLIDASKNVLQSHLRNNRTNLLWLLGDNCKNASIQWKIAALQSDAVKLLASIEEIRNYVLMLRERRLNIVQRVQALSRNRLENGWRSEFINKAQGTFKSINGTIAATKLGGELQEHWIIVNMNGLGDNLHLKYLKYKEPLRLMVTELGRLKDFENRLNAIPNAPEDLRGNYQGMINNNRQLVNDAISKLVLKGWNGQLGRQILLNKKRQQTAQGECANAIATHLELAEKANDYNTFAVAENLYEKAIATCSK